jgi:6-phosphogluconate dehydrogenase
LIDKFSNRKQKMQKADIGLVGLAVMGENLVLNMASRGFNVAVFNRTTPVVDAFIAGRAAGKSIQGTHSVEELCSRLERPRKVMLMVKAGTVVDKVIESLLPFLEPGDIVIDGGNSEFRDSIRRTDQLGDRGILFIGTGVSGGEEGALKGPSIMPGGNPEAWPHVKPVFQAIAARTDQGEPCCEWVGRGGAGHFVKMVHNGIEYGDMQMICETYQMMSVGLGLSNEAMHKVFARWNDGVLDSYLVEITRDILGYKDENGQATLDLILDTAGQKGTGKWTGIEALNMGQPLTTIAEAVFARCLSALKDEREVASRLLSGPSSHFEGSTGSMIDDLEQALYASKIVSYAQGYQLMRAMSQEMDWGLDYGAVALMWRGGCIIRSRFLENIRDAFEKNPDLANLLLDDFFARAIADAQAAWRRVAAAAATLGVPMPAIGSALAYYDGYRSERLPANLLQAQRDFFGAHTYERIDRPRGEFFHTNWTGHGGDTASSTYNI